MREEDSLKSPMVRVSMEDSVVGPYRSATKSKLLGEIALLKEELEKVSAELSIAEAERDESMRNSSARIAALDYEQQKLVQETALLRCECAVLLKSRADLLEELKSLTTKMEDNAEDLGTQILILEATNEDLSRQLESKAQRLRSLEEELTEYQSLLREANTTIQDLNNHNKGLKYRVADLGDDSFNAELELDEVEDQGDGHADDDNKTTQESTTKARKPLQSVPYLTDVNWEMALSPILMGEQVIDPNVSAYVPGAVAPKSALKSAIKNNKKAEEADEDDVDGMERLSVQFDKSYLKSYTILSPDFSQPQVNATAATSLSAEAKKSGDSPKPDNSRVLLFASPKPANYIGCPSGAVPRTASKTQKNRARATAAGVQTAATQANPKTPQRPQLARRHQPGVTRKDHSPAPAAVAAVASIARGPGRRSNTVTSPKRDREPTDNTATRNKENTGETNVNQPLSTAGWQNQKSRGRACTSPAGRSSRTKSPATSPAVRAQSSPGRGVSLTPPRKPVVAVAVALLSVLDGAAEIFDPPCEKAPGRVKSTFVSPVRATRLPSGSRSSSKTPQAAVSTPLRSPAKPAKVSKPKNYKLPVGMPIEGVRRSGRINPAGKGRK